MKYTENLKLKKPEIIDYFNIEDFNDNTGTIDSVLSHLGTTSGSGNNYIATIDWVKSLFAGLKVTINIHAASTGAATLNINNLGAKSIVKPGGGAASLKAGIYNLVYSGTNFQLLGEGGEYGTAQVGDVRSTKTIGTESGVKQGTLDLSNVKPENLKKGVIIDGITGILESVPFKYFKEVNVSQLVATNGNIQIDLGANIPADITSLYFIGKIDSNAASSIMAESSFIIGASKYDFTTELGNSSNNLYINYFGIMKSMDAGKLCYHIIQSTGPMLKSEQANGNSVGAFVSGKQCYFRITNLQAAATITAKGYVIGI